MSSNNNDTRHRDVFRRLYRMVEDGEFRARLTAVTPEGERPIVVAFKDESIRSLMERIESAGGVANVVVPWGKDEANFAIMAFVPRSAQQEHSHTPQDVGVGSTVGMLVQLAASGPHHHLDIAITSARGSEQSVHCLQHDHYPAACA